MGRRALQPDVEGRIVAAALNLFREHGFSQITMDEIAAAADVSRRTVYRRFPTKGHVVQAVPMRWLKVWDETVANTPRQRPLAMVESASLAVAAHIDAHRSDVLTAYAALAESPSLESVGTMHHQWIHRIVELLGHETTPVPTPTQHIIAGAYMGAIDAMLLQWVDNGGTNSALHETQLLLDRLRPVWPAAAN